MFALTVVAKQKLLLAFSAQDDDLDLVSSNPAPTAQLILGKAAPTGTGLAGSYNLPTSVNTSLAARFLIMRDSDSPHGLITIDPHVMQLRSTA